MDTIAVTHPDGSIKATSLKVKYGYFKVLNAKEKNVIVKVNGKETPLVLRLSETGDVYFPEEVRKRVDKQSTNRKMSFDSNYSSADDKLSLSYPQSPSKDIIIKDDSNEGINKDLFGLNEESLVMYDNPIEIKNDDKKDDKKQTVSILKNKLSEPNKIKGISSNNFDNRELKLDFLKSANNGGRKDSMISLGSEEEEDGLQWNNQYSSRTNKTNKVDEKDLLSENKSTRDKDTNVSMVSSTISTKLKISNEIDFELKRTYPEVNLEISNCWYNAHTTKSIVDDFNKNVISEEEFLKDPWAVLNNKNLAFKYNDSLYNWKAIAPMLVFASVFGKELPNESFNKLTEEERGIFKKLFGYKKETNVVKLEQNASAIKSNIDLSKEEKVAENNKKDYEWKIYYKKKFDLTSDQLKCLNLKPGKNEISFTVSSRLQGVQTMSASIYSWNYDSKIIISDVDGTITRSDFLGHVLPLFGKDWTHKGIVEFFNNIYSQGYKIMYLTARALGQSESTKKFLTTLTQEKLYLPDGPIMLSPDGLSTSIKREVIDRTPQNFKISCLLEILNLFPDDENPFYAGFGNRLSVLIFT